MKPHTHTSSSTAPRAQVNVTPSQGPQLQRKCACGAQTYGGECQTCADSRSALRRQSANDASDDLPPAVHAVLRAPGRELDAATRAFMQTRFGQDFTGVRIHTGAAAATAAKAVRAHAFTVGRDIVFGAGQYAPHTAAGQHLLAHELTHTLQQGEAPAPDRLTIGKATAVGEREADRVAQAVLGERPAQARIRVPRHLQRNAEDEAASPETDSPEATTGEQPPGPYHGCGDYREQLVATRAEAAQKAAQAVTLLDQEHLPQAAPLLQAHFHLDLENSDSRADVERIRQQFVRMRDGLNSQIRIFCRSAPAAVPGLGHRPPVDEACAGTTVANSTSCADNHPTATVKLCEIALLEMQGPLIKTVLHEFAHVACNGNPPIRSGGRGGGEVYYDGDRLPGTEPNDLVNADSYAWFALAADRALGQQSPAAGESASGGTGFGVLTALGGVLAVAGAIGLGVGIDSDSGLGIGLGIAGLGLGAVGLGIGIAGLAGAFDGGERRRSRRGRPDRGRGRTAAAPTLAELGAMSAWELAQLPAAAFATRDEDAPETGGPQRQDFARAWRLVRCIRDFHQLTIDPETTEQLGREPSAAEWAVIRPTLAQILAHANIGELVAGPGGRGELGTPALANNVRVVDSIGWGIKRFQLERLISAIGGAADGLVERWWEVAECGIEAGDAANIVDQERRMAVFHEFAMQPGLGSGGFYLPPDDTVYIDEETATQLTASTAGSAGARLTVGHELVHLLGGRETSRQAFRDYFSGELWVCYWSAFEEGMAEITTRDALSGGAARADGEYEQLVQVMRQIMQQLGEERVRRAYFTGTPDRDIFEQLRQRLPSHMDPTLPPVCQSGLRGGGSPP